MDDVPDGSDEPQSDGEAPPDGEENWYFDLPGGAWERQEQKNESLRERVRQNIESGRSRKDPFGRAPGEKPPKGSPADPKPPRSLSLFRRQTRADDPSPGQPQPAPGDDSRDAAWQQTDRWREVFASDRERGSMFDRIAHNPASDEAGRSAAQSPDGLHGDTNEPKAPLDQPAAGAALDPIPLDSRRPGSDQQRGPTAGQDALRSRWDEMLSGPADLSIVDSMRDWANRERSGEAGSEPPADLFKPFDWEQEEASASAGPAGHEPPADLFKPFDWEQEEDSAPPVAAGREVSPDLFKPFDWEQAGTEANDRQPGASSEVDAMDWKQPHHEHPDEAGAGHADAAEDYSVTAWHPAAADDQPDVAVPTQEAPWTAWRAADIDTSIDTHAAGAPADSGAWLPVARREPDALTFAAGDDSPWTAWRPTSEEPAGGDAGASADWQPPATEDGPSASSAVAQPDDVEPDLESPWRTWVSATGAADSAAGGEQSDEDRAASAEPAWLAVSHPDDAPDAIADTPWTSWQEASDDAPHVPAASWSSQFDQPGDALSAESSAADDVAIPPDSDAPPEHREDAVPRSWTNPAGTDEAPTGQSAGAVVGSNDDDPWALLEAAASADTDLDPPGLVAQPDDHPHHQVDFDAASAQRWDEIMADPDHRPDLGVRGIQRRPRDTAPDETWQAVPEPVNLESLPDWARPEGDADDVILRAFEHHAAQYQEDEPDIPSAPDGDSRPAVPLTHLFGDEAEELLASDDGEFQDWPGFNRKERWTPDGGDAEEAGTRIGWAGQLVPRPASEDEWAVPAGVATTAPQELGDMRGDLAAAAHRKRGRRHLAREIVETALLALLVFFAVRSSFQNFKVEGSSMFPTLHDGQWIIVDKLVYSEVDVEKVGKFVPFVTAGDDPTHDVFHGPQRGDIIVLKSPTQPGVDLIKRVIGLPGERIEIRSGVVYINGHALDEPYIKDAWNENRAPVVVPPDHYFVIGDNRNNSLDSRHAQVGMVSREFVIGKARLSYWPRDMFGLVSSGASKLSDAANEPAAALAPVK